MNFDANTVQLFCAVLGAVLAYTFGRFQHKKEYKENLKAQIFAYAEFIDNPQQDDNFENFENELLELRKKCSILQVSNYKKYLEIKSIILEIDELSGMQEEHIIDGVKQQINITEISALKKRKNEIHKKMLKLYRFLGVDHYRNVMYVGKFRTFVRFLYDIKFNRRNFM